MSSPKSVTEKDNEANLEDNLNKNEIQQKNETESEKHIVTNKSTIKSSNRSKTLWKLVRMKYVPRLDLRLCKNCLNALFHNKKKITERVCGGATITFDLCRKCVDLNISIKDVLCDWYEK